METANDHGKQIKDDAQYEALRHKGMSKKNPRALPTHRRQAKKVDRRLT